MPETINSYKSVQLNYLNAENMVELIRKLYPDAIVTAEKTNNHLLVGVDQQLNKILKTLQDIDQQPRTIKLKINIIELTANDLNSLGVDWNFSSEGLRIGKTAPEIQATLQALSGSGQTKILAAPNLVTLTGKPAVIHIGDRLPYALPVQQNNSTTQWQVQYIDAGINLTFLPFPAAPEQIYLEIKPEISSIRYWKQTPGGEFPVLSTRQVETNLLLKAGESFILAGLYNEEERESVQKIPLLGDIPLLNIFFRSTVRETVASDIIFVVTAEEV
jgi:type II secretory pathway component GspD/PulD (secretin)